MKLYYEVSLENGNDEVELRRQGGVEERGQQEGVKNDRVKLGDGDNKELGNERDEVVKGL